MEKTRWEDAAEFRTTLSGWVCKVCKRYWGEGESGERAARYCHGGGDQPCKTPGCPNRTGATYVKCDSCRSKDRLAKWEATTKVDWDGETPLCEWDNDRFFFDEDSLRDHIADHLAEGESIEDQRFVLCESHDARQFDIEEYLSDDLPDDDHGGSPFNRSDVNAINKTVNDWIKERQPTCWYPGGIGVNPASLPTPDPEE